MEEMVQERRILETTLTSAVTQAVDLSLDRAINEAITRTSQRLQCTHVDRQDSSAAQIQPGTVYKGSYVSPHHGAHALTVLGSR